MFDSWKIEMHGGAAGLTKRTLLFGALALGVLAAAAMLIANTDKAGAVDSTPVSTNGVTPTLLTDGDLGDGNVGQEGAECADFNSLWTGQVKTNDDDALNQPGVHEFSTPQGKIIVTISDDGKFLSFEAEFTIDAVFVKGGNDTNWYKYITVSDGDSGLASPPVGQELNTPEISHYMICWQPRDDGNEGCTLGYWKQPHHFFAWTAPYTPTTNQEPLFGTNAFDPSANLLNALNYTGGSGVTGAKQNLLRQAVAALLSAASPDVDYPLTTAQVISQVTAALNSGNRNTMLTLATQLDGYNNLGCPLGRDLS